MASVWDELKRRNVVKVAVAYAIVGWLLVQVADTFFPALQLPEWTVTFVAGLVILGFPLALILSWAYELTPDGMERTKSVPLSESMAKVTGRKLDFMIIGVLVLAITFLVVDNYVLEGRFEVEAVAEVAERPSPGGVEERTVLLNSVAVLPFENLSLDPEDAFFAVGIHEEILNQLVKLSALNVIARRSMMRYSDTDKGIPQIAEELNVETVMEGSVRYADDRVLVTAQLIDPETNAHLWSDSYNREFSDIFSIQADIAMNIANALEVQFSLAEQKSIERVATDSPEAYAIYLRAIQTSGWANRITDLSAAIEIAPNFALAYAQRAFAYATTHRFFAAELDLAELERLLRADARRALNLDPTSTVAHVAVARLEESLWNGAAARAEFERARQLNPNDVLVLITSAALLRNLGEFDEALVLNERAVELDPASHEPHHQSGHTYVAMKRYEEAMVAYEVARRISPATPGPLVQTAFLLAAKGEGEEARRRLRLAEELSTGALAAVFQPPRIAVGYALAGYPNEAQRVVEAMERLNETSPLSDVAWAYARIAVGDYEHALLNLNTAIESRQPRDFVLLIEIQRNTLQHPILDSDPGFLEARSRLRFAE